MGESRFENAVAVRRPKVDWVSEDPEGTEEHIVGVLTANKFDFAAVKTLPANLDDTQLVVFNNDNLDAMPNADKDRIEAFVQRGGGALIIAGEHNVYTDHKDLPEDALERTFPAKLAPPRSPEGTGRRAHHRQIVFDGRPQDRTGARRRGRCRGQPEAR